MLEITATITSIIYDDVKSSNFIVFKGEISTAQQNLLNSKNCFIGNSIVFAGKFAKKPFKEDTVVVSGDLIYSSKYSGYIFEFSSIRIERPATIRQIESYLKRVCGINPTRVDKIINIHKADTINQILENPSWLMGIKGISKNIAMTIFNAVKRNEHLTEAAVMLTYLKLNSDEIADILSFYKKKSDILSFLRDKPYSLYELTSLQKMDTLANHCKHPFNLSERVQAFVLGYLKHNQKYKGHLYMPLENIVKNLNTFRQSESSVYSENFTEPDILSALKELSLKRQDEPGIKIEQDCVYLNHNFLAEKKIIKHLKRHLKTSKIKFTINQSLIPSNLDDKQIDAVEMALLSNISILTGGPGTGKTSTLKAIIDNINPTKHTIQLASPTAKAAKRMTQQTGMPATTIHKLLNLQKNTCWREEQKVEINADYVIIDESSMLDAYLFSQLLEALPSHCKILLVGDIDQLASVGAGSVLKDLIESNKIPITRLDRIFRQASNSNIISASQNLISGSSIDFNSKNDFRFIENSDLRSIKEKVIQSLNHLVPKYSIDDVQVLSPFKDQEIGTIELNRLIQHNFNPNPSIPDFKFKIGDKVIQTQNDYELGVVNGEMGKIINIDYSHPQDYSLTVDFEGKEINYIAKTAKYLELAYAITIHKSQGSQWKVVVLPVHTSQKIMLSKNLLYTAFTRASEILEVHGEIAAVEIAQKKENISLRNSNIKQKLILI
jgi:exodeoxyribonuclease V alpha subunit